ncbi:MAG: hypothetical protein P1V18_04890 [Candidatus Gracilibacteria bacterium]|nr:hypothetical protein [Candidatus Gracilibacteria bacterium]
MNNSPLYFPSDVSHTQRRNKRNAQREQKTSQDLSVFAVEVDNAQFGKMRNHRDVVSETSIAYYVAKNRENLIEFLSSENISTNSNIRTVDESNINGHTQEQIDLAKSSMNKRRRPKKALLAASHDANEYRNAA